ncbi:MAG TPA: response regulator transcription factor, partial [Opitutus sp.]|nr:response regulator transcription factor [Opitutus sp.]
MNTGPLPTNSSQPASSGKRGVLLVEDHPITRNGLAALINREHNLVVCAEADNAATALDLALKHKPHIALVDITLATTTGIELMKQLKAAIPDMPVLAMSMHDESLFAERALRAGARGYVMKNEPSTTIIAAIRQVLTGEVYLSERMREKMLRGLAVSGKQDIVFPIDKLSDREMEVFQLIGEGYGTRQIAEKLGLSVKTIDSYREHLKVKLQLSS